MDFLLTTDYMILYYSGVFPEDVPGCLDKVLDNGGRVICPMDKKYIKYQRFLLTKFIFVGWIYFLGKIKNMWIISLYYWAIFEFLVSNYNIRLCSQDISHWYFTLQGLPLLVSVYCFLLLDCFRRFLPAVYDVQILRYGHSSWFRNPRGASLNIWPKYVYSKCDSEFQWRWYHWFLSDDTKFAVSVILIS